MLPTSADDVVDGDNFPKGFLQKVTVQGGGGYVLSISIFSRIFLFFFFDLFASVLQVESDWQLEI